MRGPELFLHSLDPTLLSTEVLRLVYPNGVCLLSFFFFFWIGYKPRVPTLILRNQAGFMHYTILKNGDDIKPLIEEKLTKPVGFMPNPTRE